MENFEKLNISQNDNTEQELSPVKKIRKKLLTDRLNTLVEKFGEINNTALLDDGIFDYIEDNREFAEEEAQWINEFAGHDIIEVYESNGKYRFSYIPQQAAA